MRWVYSLDNNAIKCQSKTILYLSLQPITNKISYNA